MIETHFGQRILRFDSLPSTNDYAAALAPDPAAAGTVILARTQTAGRGQYGRSWTSPAGAGLWMSIILRPPDDLRRPALLTGWAGVSVAEVVEQLIDRPATLKWPNDVLVAGKKVCGILIEQRAATIVGIGLNVNQTAEHFMAAALPDAASLASLTGRTFDVDKVANLLIGQLDRNYAAVLAGQLPGLESAWRQRLGLVSQRVVAEQVDGTLMRGHLESLTFQRLRLRLAGGTYVEWAPEQIRSIAGENALATLSQKGS